MSETSRDPQDDGWACFPAAGTFFPSATAACPGCRRTRGNDKGGRAVALAATAWSIHADPDSEVHRHPIGTLAIVGIYGVLFAVGWLLVYVYVYLSRGPVTP
jgi:hypothetical protein